MSNYILKDYTEEKYVKKGFHKRKRCDFSSGMTYGNLVVAKEGRGRGAGIAMNKENFLEAIANSSNHFKISLLKTLFESSENLVLDFVNKNLGDVPEPSSEPTQEEVDREAAEELEVQEELERDGEPEHPVGLKDVLMQFKHRELLKVVDDNKLEYDKHKRLIKIELVGLIVKNNLEGMLIE